jgi:penicillin-binding protein 1A
MTVRLAHDLGMNNVVKLPIRFGVYDHLPPLLANSLGAYETTLIRMVTGYSEFVNGGKKVSASLIDRIQDRNGRTIWRHDTRKCEGCNDPSWHGQEEPLLADPREQILDPRTAYQIVSMLQGVVQRGTAAYSVGAQINKPLAGKTGTSSDAKDTWFIGFSPDLTCGVFVGFDNPRTLGPREQGATVAAPIFRDFMKEALADEPPIPFRVPPGITLVSVDRITGAPEAASAPGAIMEAFKSGTEPGSASYLEQTAVQTQETKSTGPGTTVDQGTGGLY